MPLPLQSQEYCFIPILTHTKLVAQKNVSAPSYAAALAIMAVSGITALLIESNLWLYYWPQTAFNKRLLFAYSLT